jgi:hypothetical protein
MRCYNTTLWITSVLDRPAIILMSLLMAGCAAFGPRTAGMHGPLTWQATDLRVQPTAAKDGEAYSFTLALSETEGSARTFTRLETRFQNSRGSRPVFWEHTGQWVLPANGTLRIPLVSYRYCPYVHCSDLGALEPEWSLTLIGMDSAGQPVHYNLTLRLPASPS